jgi:UDP-N-acetyl-2-amino-2-deoxyglucuronate dehydrogenase
MRFALIGCGTIAPTHAEALAALPEAELVACCDSVPEAAHAFADRFGLRAMDLQDLLEDGEIEAVTICTPSGLHAEIGVACLLAGKHVIVEKPMDVSTAACDRLLEAQRQSGRTLAVISQHRFDPASRRVREAVEAGDLGNIHLVDMQVHWYRTQDYYDSGNWRGTWELDGGGCLMNQGVHTVDLLRWLGGPVATVQALTRTAAHERIEVEDVVVAMLTFENGAVGTLSASTAAYPGFAARLALFGSRGSAVIEGDGLRTLAIQGGPEVEGEAPGLDAVHVAQGGTRTATAEAALIDSGPRWGDSHRAQLADFIECCRTGRTPLVDGREGRSAVELVTAVYESARTGGLVTLKSAA